MSLARIFHTRGSSRREGVLHKRPDLKRSANGPRSQRVRAGKLGQNAVRWSAFVPLRPGTSRAPALGQHAREEALIKRLETESARAPARNWSEPPHVGCKDLGRSLSVAVLFSFLRVLCDSNEALRLRPESCAGGNSSNSVSTGLNGAK